ncbi:MAG: carbohydrate-binding protein [Bacteroidota bacterium]
MKINSLQIRSLFLSLIAGLLFLAQPAAAQDQKYAALFYFPIFGDSFYHPVNISPSGDSWIQNGQNPPFSPFFVPNFWGKPYWAATHGDGTIKNNFRMYINSPATPNNELLDWHADLMAQAGVDFIVFDNTNGTLDYTPSGPEYVSCMQAVCNRWQWRMQQGLPTPKIVFFVMDEVNLGRVENLFFTKYSPDLFFNYLGKKLVLVADALGGDSDRGNPVIQPAVPTHGKFGNYTTRHCWALNNEGAFWNFKTNAVNPPPPFMYQGQPEQVCAPVSCGGWERDRFLPGSQGRDNGKFFTKYMDYAKTSGAKIVFIHSWNEWVSPNISSDPDNQTHPFFVDQYLTEFSSDIEPMAGGHGFQYYDLMKTKIAEFKGTTPTEQTPYAGVIPIPGFVEAENFDNGGEGVSYHDTTPTNLIGPFRTNTAVDIENCSEGGSNLAFSADTEWLEYTVKVAAAGAYTFDARVSSPFTTGRFHIEMDGTNVTGALSVPNTGGWQTWTNVSKTVNLTAGQHIMRFVIDTKEFNTNKFNFTAQGAIQTPFPGPNAAAIPGTVEAENFDNGGESIAYHDSEEANQGGVGSRLGPDVFTCVSSEGTNALGWINNGEWMEYTVNAASAGSFNINARVASVFNTGVFHLEWDGVNISGNIAVPNTGDWQTWQSVTKTVTLTAGQHILRVFADAGNFNLNKITFSQGGNEPFPVSGSVYRLVNRQSGKVLDVNECALTNGMKVQQWTWLGGNCQRWKFTATDNGYFKITAQHSNQALEIGSALTTDGAKANQWPSNDCFCQQWKVEATSGGFYKLTARHSTQVLEVGSALMTDGAQVNQFPWNTAACQQWAIEPIAAFARQGVEEVSSAATPAIQLSPNPANDLVTVTWAGIESKGAVLAMVNMKGQKVYTHEVKGTSHTIRTTEFNNGLYIITLKSGQTTVRKKVIVKH